MTQVEVDKNDPGFAHPTKPIGAFFSESQRDELQKANPDWRFVEDAGRGYRRVVASPEPQRIVEAPAIKALIQQGFVVIGAGGGGIPVVCSEAGITKAWTRLSTKISLPRYWPVKFTPTFW